MVEYKDGSCYCSIRNTDMRLPIQYAINYPERREAVADKLDFINYLKLTFEKPDIDTFKCLELSI